MRRFYRECGRDLPWRRTVDPYRIVVSELMLQQTPVDRVIPRYHAFIDAFPDFGTLARAPQRDVLARWQGLGYNRRALYLHRIAMQVMEEHAGHLPDDPVALQRFPGIGPATAASIAAFAFNRPVVFIETNIRRVFLHFFFEGEEDVPDRRVLPLVAQTLDGENPRDWYNALMDLGTVIARTGGNANRRSREYLRQSPFEGSNRQIRGEILRALVDAESVKEDDIRILRDTDPVRRERILRALEREGFITRRRSGIRIPGGKENGG
ncbi:MAG: A/G-specific adenine glycosylase [Methanomicrobiales archaeon]